MINEYIIINKTAIQQIDELIKEANMGIAIPSVNSQMAESLIRFKEQLLSQSTPLIPEIKNAFDAGAEWGYDTALTDERGWGETSSKTFENKQDYISNLKLDV